MTARPRFRRLRRVATAVLVLLVALMLGVAWLVGTSPGARFALARVQGLVPGALSIGRVDGTLLGTLEITGIEYAIDDTRVAVGQLALQVAPGVLFNFRRVTVRSLRLDGVTVRYAASAPGAASEAGPPVVPDVTLPALPVAINLERLEANDIAFGPVSGELQRIDRTLLAARVAGRTIELRMLVVEAPTGRLTASGRADLASRLGLSLIGNWSLADASGTRGALRISGDRDGYEVRHDLRAPLVVVSEGTVRLPAGEEPEFRLRHVAPALEAELGGRQLGFGGIDVETSGRYTGWHVRGRADVTETALGSAVMMVTVSGNGAAVVAEAIELSPERGGALSLTGAIDGWPDAQWRARLEARDTPLALVAPDVEGALDATIEATGGLGAEPFAQATIEALSGRWRGVDIDAGGALSWRSGAATFDAVQIAVGANTARIDGRIATDAAADADLAFEIDAPDLAAISPDLSGRMSASGRIVGRLKAPEVDARFAIAGLRTAGAVVASADGSLVVAADSASFGLDARASGISAGTIVVEDVEFAARGTPASHTISIEGLSEPLPTASLSAAGGLVDGAWRGRVTALDATLPDAYAVGAIALVEPFEVALSGDGLSVGPACLAADPSPTLCAQAALDGDVADLRASLSGLPLAALAEGAPFGLEWAGTANAELVLEGPRDRLSGSARLSVDELAATRQDVAGASRITFDDARVEATLDNGVLDASARFSAAGGGVAEAALAFGDVYGGDGSLAGRVALTVPDVTAVNAFLDNVRFSEGEFRAEARLGGTRDTPVITSRIDASEVSARLLPLGIEIGDVRIDADNENSRVLRFSGSGRSGEGRFEMRGETLLGEGEGFATRATVRADQFTFLDLPDRQAVASMDLALTADRERQSLTGDLTVDRANIRVQALPETAVQVSPDTVRVGEGDTADELGARIERTMEVTVTLSDAVRLDAFGLSGRLEGAMDLRKRAEAVLQGFGAVDVRDGVYKAYGQSLEVERGRLVFNGPLDAPVLEVRAEREVADKRVGIEIAGTPDALESSIYSEPPLPEAEAFSLLITGRSLAAAGQAGDTPLGDIALALGLREAFAVGSAVRDAVGLDTLRLEGGGSDGRVLAGKQISPGLYLEYAYGVFDQLSSVLLRLQINERLSLESTSGQAQSVDLVYSVGAR